MPLVLVNMIRVRVGGLTRCGALLVALLPLLVVGCGDSPGPAPSTPNASPTTTAATVPSGVVVVASQGANCIVQMLDPISGDKTDYATFDVSRNTPDSPGCPIEGAAKAPFVFSPDFKRLAAVQNVDSGGKSLGWINSSGANCADRGCGPGGFEPVAPIDDPAGWKTVIVPLSFGFDAKGRFNYTKRRGPGAGDDRWHVEQFIVDAGKPANSGEGGSEVSRADEFHVEWLRDAGGWFMAVTTQESAACGLPVELDREYNPDRAVFYFFARDGQLFKSADWCTDKGSVAFRSPGYDRIFDIVSSPCGDKVIFRATTTPGAEPASYIADTSGEGSPEFLPGMSHAEWPYAAWGFYRWVSCP
jgi:hypothetical protein